MSHQELLDTLRREGERRIEALRREAEKEAEAVREDVRRRGEELQAQGRRQEALTLEETAGVALRETRAEAARIRLGAERALAERLWRLARETLPELRDGAHGAAFATLAGELPPADWQTVRVNPADLQRARERFADAEILADGAVSGGLEAAGAGVRIVNTLEKRLERAWAGLLSRLLNDIHRKVDGHDVPAAD